ncbi:conserved hypothetical protein [Vibrio chagasii]|nr:conserved hypothetical protein [Vibrio chagasii]
MPSLQYKLFSRTVSLLPLETRLKVLFFRRFKYILNLKKPERLTTFNEKIQYLKVTERDPLLTIAADKVASKNFVKKICPNLYVPENLWHGFAPSDVDHLDFSQLPCDYVFKANHTSQTIEIIRNGNNLTKEKMKQLSKSWLSHDQASSLGEWAYQDIPRTVFIEEFLDFEGEAPDDYKFFVYHGKVHFIQLDSDRFTDHRRNMFDRNWCDLEFSYNHPRKEPVPARPIFFEEMVEVAEKIGANFKFVRVDLYFYDNKVTFGELTIYPGAGFERFPNKDWDQIFGKPLNLFG